MTVNRRLDWFLMLVMLTVLAACGGGGDDDSLPPSMSESGSGTPAATEIRPTFPPTWTPVPTQPSATPRPTLEYTYAQPTLPTFIPPTYTSSPAPPTRTPAPTRVQSGPVATQPPVVQTQSMTLQLSAALLNQAAQAEFEAGAVPYLLGAPGFNFAPPDTVIVLVNMQTEANDPATAATVVIRATIGLQAGKITLTQVGTNRLGDTAVVQLPLVDALLDTLEVRIDTAIRAYFTGIVPGGLDYTITSVEVIEGAVSLTVNAVIQSQGGTQAGTPTSAPQG